MKAASLTEIKKELTYCSKENLIDYVSRLARFKKENKELLTYLLFEQSSEENYVQEIKKEVTTLFSEINKDSYYYIKKSIRKILRRIKTYSRYSIKKETEIELLIFFCEQLKTMKPSYLRNVALTNLYQRQIVYIRKSLKSLHEDLQYDYNLMLEEL